MIPGLFLMGCDDDGESASADCSAVCEYVAECSKACDPSEEPSCDEEKNYQEALGRCTSECEAGLGERGATCEASYVDYKTCLEGRTCEDDGLGACPHESRQYHELCVGQPGDLVCAPFCSELEVGCTPYAVFDIRGAGCEATCGDAAKDLSCLEALYLLDECEEPSGYSCEPISDDCLAEAQGAAEACDWKSVTADMDEVTFCEKASEAQCDCGLWPAGDCQALATQRCLYSLGFGADCKAATEAFDECIGDIMACDRDALRDSCKPEWDAYAMACSP
ncbi:MAG: hypothetical protein KC416_03995 [Myxococcales bacterium]|nr:hypothetical protein [Myxococcales bacterium]